MLREIKHVSFDVWGTILKENPQYIDARFDVLQTYFPEFERNFLMQKFNDNEKIISKMNEVYGRPLSSEQYYYLFFASLFPSYDKFISDSGETRYYMFFTELVRLMDKYPPLLVDGENLGQVFKILKEKNITTSVCCDTTYISGFDITATLHNHYNLLQYIDLTLYSDDIGVTKNDFRLQSLVLHRYPYEHEDILHVGDDEIIDIKCPDENGVQTFLFLPSTPNTLQILNHINTEI